MSEKKNKTILVAEPGKQEIFVMREFDAPRKLVFMAFTDPKVYIQWLGPRGYTMRLETFEPRSGGSWRYIHTDPQGNQFGFHGVNHEVLPPERIIDTFEFEGNQETGHVMLETVRFEELPGGRTKVKDAICLPVGGRPGWMVQSGMERGVVDSHERLDEVLEKLQK